MQVKIIDPSCLPDWNHFIQSHFDPDIFHTSEWCRILKFTYNLSPTYFLAYNKEQPVIIIPLIEIKSPFTGKRAVCLPFSDFCHPLVKEPSHINELIKEIADYGVSQKWKYIEFRSSCFSILGRPVDVYYTHDIDLETSSDRLWSRLKENNKRNIKKATKYGLQVRFEKGLQSLRDFYKLQVTTRKRHGLPPQPYKYFKLIHDEIISKDLGIIAAVYYRNNMIAASIYFHFNKKALFKFGASNHIYHRLRPNNLIMWEAIRWHKENGCYTLNLGRTDMLDVGLISYKRTWGAKETQLYYYRLIFKKNLFSGIRAPGKNRILTKAGRIIPAPILNLIGNLIYRHLA